MLPSIAMVEYMILFMWEWKTWSRQAFCWVPAGFFSPHVRSHPLKTFPAESLGVNFLTTWFYLKEHFKVFLKEKLTKLANIVVCEVKMLLHSSRSSVFEGMLKLFLISNKYTVLFVSLHWDVKSAWEVEINKMFWLGIWPRARTGKSYKHFNFKQESPKYKTKLKQQKCVQQRFVLMKFLDISK